MRKAELDTEILELAITREIEAYNLYMKLSRWASDPRMKDSFERLAKEEIEHKARLELEIMKLGVVVRTSGENVIEQADDDSEEPILDMNYKDMLLFAIKKERMALRLYIDMAAMTKDKVSREMLVTLAEDEAMHEARFEVEYNMLMRRESK